jgi:sarcosine oxidase subunit beta
VEGFLAATGCCGAGIAACGGVGLALATLAAQGASPVDLSAFRADRFGPIDPLSLEFQQRCAAARSHKTSG